MINDFKSHICLLNGILQVGSKLISKKLLPLEDNPINKVTNDKLSNLFNNIFLKHYVDTRQNMIMNWWFL